MRKHLYLSGCAGLMVLGLACSSSPSTSVAVNHDADIKAIKDLEASWVKAYAAKDVDKAVASYADDATLMVSNMPGMNGKEAIRAGLKELISDPKFSLVFQASKVEISKAGDMAYSQGTYTLTVSADAKNPKSKLVTDKGKYVTVYKKQADGAFKAVADIDNSDLPLPTAKKASPGKSGTSKRPAHKG